MNFSFRFSKHIWQQASAKLKSLSESIVHENFLEWLRSMAERLIPDTIMPTSSSDPVFAMRRAFLHTAFLYIDLRYAIRHENGPQIVRMWKLWLPWFIGTGRKKYAMECVYVLAIKIVCRFS